MRMRRITAAIVATLLPVIGVFASDVTPARANDNDRAQLNPCAVPNEIVGSSSPVCLLMPSVQ